MIEEIKVSELRSNARYLTRAPIEASFGSAAVNIVNFSTTGIQARHAEPLKLGTEARLSFTLPGTNARVSLRGRVVWSHMAQAADARGKHPYFSGIRVDEQTAELETALGSLLKMQLVQPDTEWMQKKRAALREKAKERATRQAFKVVSTSPTSDLSADEILMVQHARERLQSHPDEAVKWYARAKFALKEDEAKIGALVHYKDDVLAVWEYLERTIDLDKIVRIFESLRK